MPGTTASQQAVRGKRKGNAIVMAGLVMALLCCRGLTAMAADDLSDTVVPNTAAPDTTVKSETAPGAATIPGTASSDKNSDSKKPANTASGTGKSDKSFTPSEQISEDLSVPFPIDI